MKIYAHRGSRNSAREHSVDGYLNAISEGVDGFECDVRVTLDNQLLLWHDKNTSRFNKYNQRISKTNYSELQIDQKITAQELLLLALKHKKNIAFETKHPVRSGKKVELLLIELINRYINEINQ